MAPQSASLLHSSPHPAVAKVTSNPKTIAIVETAFSPRRVVLTAVILSPYAKAKILSSHRLRWNGRVA
jgi:hypothetical protein